MQNHLERQFREERQEDPELSSERTQHQSERGGVVGQGDGERVVREVRGKSGGGGNEDGCDR